MSNWPSLSLKMLQKGLVCKDFTYFILTEFVPSAESKFCQRLQGPNPAPRHLLAGLKKGECTQVTELTSLRKSPINESILEYHGISWTEKLIESSWKSIHHINRNWYKHRKDRSRACARCCTFHIISPFLCKIKFRKLTEHCHPSQRFAPPEISLRPPQQWYALCPSPTWAADGLWTSLSFDFCILFDSCNSCNNIQHIFCHWLN